MFIVWLTGTATLALLAGAAWYLAPLYPGVIMLALAYTPKSFGTIVHAWPAEYLLLYRDFLPFNFLLLGSFGAFGYFFVSRSPFFFQWSPTLRTVAAWALPIAAILGAAVNALHIWLTAVPRFGIPLVYAFAAACAASQWAILAGFTLALIYALLRDER